MKNIKTKLLTVCLGVICAAAIAMFGMISLNSANAEVIYRDVTVEYSGSVYAGSNLYSIKKYLSVTATGVDMGSFTPVTPELEMSDYDLQVTFNGVTYTGLNDKPFTDVEFKEIDTDGDGTKETVAIVAGTYVDDSNYTPAGYTLTVVTKSPYLAANGTALIGTVNGIVSPNPTAVPSEISFTVNGNVYTTTPTVGIDSNSFLSLISIVDGDSNPIPAEFCYVTVNGVKDGTFNLGNNTVTVTYSPAEGQSVTSAPVNVNAQQANFDHIEIEVDPVKVVMGSDGYYFRKVYNPDETSELAAEWATMQANGFVMPENDNQYYAFITGMDNGALSSFVNVYAYDQAGVPTLVPGNTYSIDANGKITVTYSSGSDSGTATLVVPVKPLEIMSLEATYTQGSLEITPSSVSSNTTNNIRAAILEGGATLSVTGMRNNGRVVTLGNAEFDLSSELGFTPESKDSTFDRELTVIYTNTDGTRVDTKFNVKVTNETITGVRLQGAAGPQTADTTFNAAGIEAIYTYGSISGASFPITAGAVDRTGAEPDNDFAYYKVYYFTNAYDGRSMPAAGWSSEDDLTNGNAKSEMLGRSTKWARIAYYVDGNKTYHDVNLTNVGIDWARAPFALINVNPSRYTAITHGKESDKGGLEKEITLPAGVASIEEFIAKYGATVTFYKDGAENTENIYFSGNYVVANAVGRYTVEFKLADTGDYKWLNDSSSVTTLSSDNFTYTLVFEVLRANGSATITFKDNPAIAGTDKKVYPSGTNPDFTVEFIPEDPNLPHVVYDSSTADNTHELYNQFTVYYYGKDNTGEFNKDAYNAVEVFPDLPGDYTVFVVIKEFSNYNATADKNNTLAHTNGHPFNVIKNQISIKWKYESEDDVPVYGKNFGKTTAGVDDGFKAFEDLVLTNDGIIDEATGKFKQLTYGTDWWFVDGTSGNKLDNSAVTLTNVKEYELKVRLSDEVFLKNRWNTTTGDNFDEKKTSITLDEPAAGKEEGDVKTANVVFTIRKYTKNNINTADIITGGATFGGANPTPHLKEDAAGVAAFARGDATSKTEGEGESAVTFTEYSKVKYLYLTKAQHDEYIAKAGEVGKDKTVLSYYNSLAAKDKITTPSDAGTYYVYMYLSGTTQDFINYNYCEGWTTYSISPKEVDDLSAPDDITYGESGNSATISGWASYYTLSKVDGLTYSNGTITAENAGKYTITVSLNSNNYTWADASSAHTFVWTVKRAVFDLQSVIDGMQPDDFYYNGAEQSATYNGGDKFADVNEEQYTLSGCTGTAKGDYSVIFTLTQNYCLPGNDGDPESAENRTLSLAWAIKDFGLAVNEITDNSKTYAGAAQNFTVEITGAFSGIYDTAISWTLTATFGSNSPVTLTKDDNLSIYGISVAVNEDTNNLVISARYAGSYTLTVNITDTHNIVWKDGAAKSASFEITKANLDISWKFDTTGNEANNTNYTITFSKTNFESNTAYMLVPTVKGVGDDSFGAPVYATYTDDTAAASANAINAGDYYSVVTALIASEADIFTGFKLSDNYNTVDGKDYFGVKKFTVNPYRVPVPMSGAVNVFQEYDGNEHTFSEAWKNITGNKFNEISPYTKLYHDGHSHAYGTVKFTDVMWNENGKLGSYEYFIVLDNPDGVTNYVWDDNNSTTDGVARYFVIYPKAVNVLTFTGGLDTDNVKTVEYTKNPQTLWNFVNNANKAEILSMLSAESKAALQTEYTDVKRDGDNNVVAYEYSVELLKRADGKSNYAWYGGPETSFPVPAAAGGTYEQAAKNYGLKITPVTLELTWTGESFTYSGSAQNPALDFSKKVLAGDTIGITVEYSVRTTNGHTGALTGDNAVNAGYYTATAKEITGANAVNYLLPEDGTCVSDFVINRKAVTIAAADSNPAAYTYNKSEQGYVYNVNGVADGENVNDVLTATLSAEYVNGTSETLTAITYGANTLTFNGVYAGTYTVAATLGGNYAWDSDAAPEAEQSVKTNSDWKIEKREVVAPTILDERTFERSSSAQYPNKFTGYTVTGDTIALPVTIADGETVWTVNATISYADKTSQAVGFYTLDFELSDGDNWNYFITSEMSDYMSLGLSGHEDIISEDGLKITVTYRITLTRHQITFTVTDWTYGDEVNPFVKDGDVADGYTHESERSVKYYVNSGTAESPVYDSTKPLTDAEIFAAGKTDEGNNYYPAHYPFKAGKYVAVITYKGVNDLYDEQDFPVAFTISELEVTLSWTNDSVEYDGLTTHKPTISATNLKTYTNLEGDTVGGSVGYTLDAGEEVKSAKSYTFTLTALTGADAGNYKLPANNTHGFTITPRAIKLYAPTATFVFGDSTKIAANGILADLHAEYHADSKHFVEDGILESFQIQGYNPADDSVVLYNTDVGTYGTRVVEQTLSNYTITYISDADGLEITQRIVSIDWNNPTLTYNGEDQSAAVVATYKDITGANITVTDITITFGGETAVFKNAGDYTFTVNSLEDGNYKLPASGEEAYATLTEEYTIAKRTVYVHAADATSVYGAHETVTFTPAEGWSYNGASAADTLLQFVAADNIALTAKSAVTETDTPADTNIVTYLMFGETVLNEGADGNVVDGNYLVIVVNGAHTVTAATLTINWDELTAKTFTYNGKDQTDGAQVVKFSDGVGGADYLLKVIAVKDTSSTTSIEFTDAGTYTFYVADFADEVSDTIKNNYNLPEDTTRYQGGIVMNKAKASITADSVTNHIYGDDIQNRNLTFKHEGFFNDYNQKFTAYTDAANDSDVGDYKVCLEFAGEGDVKTQYTENGTVEHDNYIITITIGGFKIIPVDITVTVSDKSATYGLENDKVVITADSVAYASGDKTGEEIDDYSAIFTLYPSSATSGVRNPVGDNYFVRLRLLSGNYKVTCKNGEDSYVITETGNGTFTDVGKFTINNAPIINTQFTPDGALVYSGSAQKAFERLAATYFGPTTNRELQTIDFVTPSTKLNNIRILYLDGGKNATVAAEAFSGFATTENINAYAEALKSAGWSENMPEYTNAGEYHVRVIVLADNHTPIQSDDITVTVKKATVTVNATVNIIYGQDVPANEFVKNNFVYVSDLFHSEYDADGSALKTQVDGVSISYDKSAYTKGGDVGTYNFNLNTTGGLITGFGDIENFEFKEGETKLVVSQLHITVAVTAQSKAYWTEFELNAESNYNVTVDDKDYDGAADIVIPDSYGAIFTLTSEALTDGIVTADVNTYDIVLKLLSGNYALTVGYDTNPELDCVDETATANKFTVTEALLTVNGLHGYGQYFTGGAVYDEKAHAAVHRTGHENDDHNYEPDVTTFYSVVDGKTPVTISYIILKDEAGNILTDGASIAALFTAGTGVVTTMPTVKDKGVYYVYAMFEAKNHGTEYRGVTATVSQATNSFDSAYSLGDWTYGDFGSNAEHIPQAAFKDNPDNAGNIAPVIELYKGDTKIAEYIGSWSGTVYNGAWQAVAGSGFTNLAHLGYGAYTVKYSMAGNDNFKAIAETAATFSVDKKSVTVSANNQTIKYGVALDTSDYIIDETALVFGESVADVITGVPHIVAYRKVDSGLGHEYVVGFEYGGAGEYEIRISEGTQNALTSENYSFNFVSGTLIVEKIDITITFSGAPVSESYNFYIGNGLKDTPKGLEDKARITSGEVYNNEKLYWLTSGAYAQSNLTFEDGFATGLKDSETIKANGTNDVNSYILTAEYTKYSANYNITTVGEVYHVISRAILSITVTDDESKAGSNGEYTVTYSGEGRALIATNADSSVTAIRFNAVYAPAGTTDDTLFVSEKPVNAGTYAVRFRTEGDGASNYFYNDTVTYTLIISPKQFNISLVYSNDGANIATAASYIYNGKAYEVAPADFTASLNNQSGESVVINVTYAYDSGVSGISLENGLPVHAGSYTATFTLVDTVDGKTTNNYRFALSGNTNYGLTQTSGLQITKATAKAPAANWTGSREYNGKTEGSFISRFENGLNPFDNEYIVDLSVVYTPWNTNFGGGYTLDRDNPTHGEISLGRYEETDSTYRWYFEFKDAGTYTFTAKLNYPNDYQWQVSVEAGEDPVADRTRDYVITQKDLVVTTEDAEITYGALLSTVSFGHINAGIVETDVIGDVIHGTPVYTTSNGGNAYIDGSDRTRTPSPVGSTFDVIVSGLESNNYNLIFSGDGVTHGQLKVTPKDIDVTVQDIYGYYDGVAHTSLGDWSYVTGADVKEQHVSVITSILSVAANALEGNDTLQGLDVTFEQIGKDVAVYNPKLSSSNGNYNINFSDFSIEIKPSTLTATIKAGTQQQVANGDSAVVKTDSGFTVTYGSAIALTGDNRSFDVDYSGWKSYDVDINDLAGSVTFTVTKGGDAYTSVAIAGEKYTVSLVIGEGGISHKNYKIDCDDATLTIISRTITAAFDKDENGEEIKYIYKADDSYEAVEQDVKIAFGNATVGDPEYARAYTGTLVNGDTVNDVSKVSHAGTYTVKLTLDQNGNNEYNYVFADGGNTLEIAGYTIEQEELPLAWAYTTVEYGGGNTNRIPDFNGALMEVSSYRFEGVDADVDYVDGVPVVTPTAFGTGIIIIAIKTGASGSNEYFFANDYILVNNRTNVKNNPLTLTFTTHGSEDSVVMHVSLAENATGWVYDVTYNPSWIITIEGYSDAMVETMKQNIEYTYAEITEKGWSYQPGDEGITDAHINELASAFTPSVPLNVGTYVVRAVLRASATEGYGGGRATFVFEITQRTIAVTPSIDGDDEYTGETLTASIENFDANLMILSYTGLSNVNGNDVTLYGTEAGDYKAYVSLRTVTGRKVPNYKWDETLTLDDSGRLELTWKIKTATNTVSDFALSATNVTYGTTVTPSASSQFGTVVYEYTEYGLSKWTVGLPKDAGKYSVRATVAEGVSSNSTENNKILNYTAAESDEVTFEITRAKLTLKVDDITATYGDALESIATTSTVIGYAYGEDGLVIIHSYTIGVEGDYYTQGSDAGTYIITANANLSNDPASNNYELNYPSVAGTLTVVKKRITITAQPQSAPYNIANPLAKPVLDDTKYTVLGLYGEDSVKVELSLAAPADATKGYVAGYYTITPVFDTAATENRNYTATVETGRFQVEIYRINLSKFDVDANLTYNPLGGRATGTFVINYTVGGEDFTYDYVAENGDENDFIKYFSFTLANYPSLPNAAGTYTLSLVSNDTANVIITGNNLDSFVINKYSLNGVALQSELESAGILSTVYDGTAKNIDNTALQAKLTEWYEGLFAGEDLSLLASPNVSVVCGGGTNVGNYAVSATLVSGSFNNFRWETTDTDTRPFTFEIIKASPTIALTGSASHVYDGTAPNVGGMLTVTVPAYVGSGYVFEFASKGQNDWKSNAPVNAGEYDVRVIIPDNANWNAAESTNTVALTIDARRVTVNARATVGGTYNENVTSRTPVAFTYANAHGDSMTDGQITAMMSSVTLKVTYHGSSFGGIDIGNLDDAGAILYAGIYSVTVKGDSANIILDGADSDGNLEFANIYTIEREAIYGDLINVLTFTYNGQEHSALDAVHHAGNPNYGSRFTVATEDNTKGTDAGTYTFNVSLADTNNTYWRANSSEKASATVTAKRSLTFIIGRANVTSLAVDALRYEKDGNWTEVGSDNKGWTYNDDVTAVSGDVSGNVADILKTSDYVFEYRASGSSSFVSGVPVNAGTYEYRVRITQTLNFSGNLESETKTVIISKLGVQAPTLNNHRSSFNYTGNAYLVTFNGYNAAIMGASYVGGGNISSDISATYYAVNTANVGEHTVTFNLRDTNNYEWTVEAAADGYTTVNATNGTAAVKWTITIAGNTITAVNVRDITYGETMTGTVEATFGANTVRFMYTLKTTQANVTTITAAEEAALAEGLPQANAGAGTYWIKAIINKPADNSYESATAYKTAVVAKRALTVRAANGSVEYGEAYVPAAEGFTLIGMVNGDTEESVKEQLGTATPAYSVAYKAGDAVGSAYRIEIASVDAMNEAENVANYSFTFYNQITGTITVVPRAITIRLENQRGEYGESVGVDQSMWHVSTTMGHGLYGSDKESDLDVVLNVILVEADGYLPAGTYSIEGEFKANPAAGKKNGNYAATFIPAIYTVTKKEVDLKELERRAKEAGLLNLTYTGEEQTLSEAQKKAIEELSKEFTKNSEGVDLADGETIFEVVVTSGVGTNAGTYSVQLKIKDKFADDFKWEGIADNIPTSSIPFEIEQFKGNKVELEIITSTGTIEREYDGRGLEITSSMYNFTADFSAETRIWYAVSINGEPGGWTLNVPSDAGEYFARIEVMETPNFNGAYSNEISFSISPRKIVAEITAEGGVYEGDLEAASVDFALFNNIGMADELLRYVSYEIYYYGTSFDGTWSATASDLRKVHPRVAGDYTVGVKLSFAGNYELVDSDGNIIDTVTASYKVAKAEINTANILPNDLTYNGSEQSADTALNHDGNFGKLYSTVTKSVGTKAGEYTATLTLSDSANYKWDSSDEATTQVKWRILKVKVARPTVQNGIVQDNVDFFVLTPFGYDSEIMNISGNEVSGYGDHDIVVSLKDKDNYEWINGSTDDIALTWTLERVVPVAFILIILLLSVLLLVAIGGTVYGGIVKHKDNKKYQELDSQNADNSGDTNASEADEGKQNNAEEGNGNV